MYTPEIAQEILEKQRNEQIELAKMVNGQKDASPEKWAKCCEDNLNFIHDTIKKHGWPAAHLFADEQIGQLVEYAAWLRAQHGQ